MRLPKPQSTLGAFAELIAIVALALGLALAIQAVIVKPFQIPSGSMIPTLEINQRILVNRFIYSFTDPGVGDVVVFNPPSGAVNGRCGVAHGDNEACPESTGKAADTNFVKRIVAGPGDRLRIENGHAIVNGQVATEGFTKPCGGMAICNLTEEITIPPDQYFVMGDNRGASDDSRAWGPIERDWIVGKTFATYWPPDRLGIF